MKKLLLLCSMFMICSLPAAMTEAGWGSSGFYAGGSSGGSSGLYSRRLTTHRHFSHGSSGYSYASHGSSGGSSGLLVRAARRIHQGVHYRVHNLHQRRYHHSSGGSSGHVLVQNWGSSGGSSGGYNTSGNVIYSQPVTYPATPSTHKPCCSSNSSRSGTSKTSSC